MISDDELTAYLAQRERRRLAAVNRVFQTLKPYERRLVWEAAVMGFIRGRLAGSDLPPPDDPAIVVEVLDAAITIDEHYPYLAAASAGRRRHVTKSRLWPGERQATPRTRTRAGVQD